jgi:RNA methyltransferase, TrmH family
MLLSANIVKTIITSRRHPLVQRYRALARGDGDADAILLEGPHLVREALAAGCVVTSAAITRSAADREEGRALVEMLARAGAEISTVADDVMSAASPVKTPWGIVAIAERRQVDTAGIFDRTPPLIVLAVDVQDPGNVGAMIRAAEAGGATGFITGDRTADPFSWRALRGSMGSAFRLPVSRATSAEVIACARKRRIAVAAAGPRGGRSLFESDLRGPIVFAVGGEGGGLPRDVLDHADMIITIPMTAPVESLNVAISTALLVYEARRQR